MSNAPLYASVAQATPDGGWPASWGAAEQATAVRFASLYVRDATRFDVYLADPATGLPADPALADVFRDAAVLTVAAWVRAGVRPWLGGVPEPAVAGAISSISGGGRSISYATETPAQTQARQDAETSISPAARMLLRANGLGARTVGAVRR